MDRVNAKGTMKNMKAKDVAKAKKRSRRMGLMNWPPSRGPMPAWMRSKPEYVIPEPEIEMIEWTLDTSKGGYKKPATPIKVIPTKPAPKAVKLRGARGAKKGSLRVFFRKDLIASHDAEREFDLSLNAHVATMATLKPEQLDLVGGAVLVEPNRRRGIRKSYASIDTRLPTRAITVDISYPLCKIARVTVKPYTYRSARSRSGPHRGDRGYENMSVGYLLYQLARAYKTIYKSHAKWGVWGHAITDLVFERLKIKDNVGEVSIGS